MTAADARRLAQAAAKAKASAGPPVTRDVLEAAVRLQLTEAVTAALAGKLETAEGTEILNRVTDTILAVADRYKAGA